MNDLQLLKNNNNRKWEDLEWVEEFYEFLQGKLPKGISIQEKPKMDQEQAFSIIWYLQEQFPLIPCKIERCEVCGTLFDSEHGGIYTENSNVEGHHHFCDNDCEARYSFPVSSMKELLREVKETLVRNPEYDWYDSVILMYECNDQINRDERYVLEEYFEENGTDNINKMSHEEKITWIEGEIKKHSFDNTETENNPQHA